MIGITTAGITGNIEKFYLLRDAGIQQIDCSITSILKCSSINDVEIGDVVFLNEVLALHRIHCNSLQSIFYGCDHAFKDFNFLKNHMEKCFGILTKLNCNNVLFGSPMQRKNMNFAKIIVKFMNEIASHHNKLILIENLDYFEETWGQKTKDIQDEIDKNNLTNCAINLHVFVEDPLNLDTLDLKKINSIHLSNKEYGINLLEKANVETLEKVKDIYRVVPNISLEITKCSLEQSVNEFENFRKKWEYL